LEKKMIKISTLVLLLTLLLTSEVIHHRHGHSHFDRWHASSDDERQLFVDAIRQRMVDVESRNGSDDDGTPRMHMLWSTPILHVNLASLAPELNVNAMNEALRHVIVDEHERLVSELALNRSAPGDSELAPNRVFFDYQTRHVGAFEAMFDGQHVCGEAKRGAALLAQLWQHMIDQYLTSIGATERDIERRARTLSPWATVHSDCMNHALHTHPDNSVSGVYYVNVPTQGSGRLVFHDVRGMLPPFDNRHIVAPKPGDLVLFPSWLPHQVEASTTAIDNPRISIAFNVPGPFDLTSAVSATLELM
jgi:Putative 2OG-Fe(II) oxygenase